MRAAERAKRAEERRKAIPPITWQDRLDCRRYGAGWPLPGPGFAQWHLPAYEGPPTPESGVFRNGKFYGDSGVVYRDMVNAVARHHGLW